MTAAGAGPGAAQQVPERGEIVLQGRVMPASNATFVGEVDGVRVVYKPVAGERPLWDFPDGTLAAREVAAYEVSQALGWGVVPHTVLRDGPHGVGMVQRWQDADPEQQAVDIVDLDDVPEGYLHVFDGVDGADRPVSLVHEDTAALRRMAVFDVLVNNADRKGGHVLAMPDGHRYGVDHGVCFHEEPKLRTVLWGWAGLPVTPPELDGVRRVRVALDGPLGDRLLGLLSAEEVAATRRRADRLLATATMPMPQDGWPTIPWPPF
ncbi:SCO1664 family protein [Nocardioides campestrisoli]|uniref:SCO1664 family protein n=1 Tax=Nocardioides campestrisoli TaxID=2736757 RepID=UPI001CD1E24F|nr:SCO1664 family protein [Nocardioides campestrisoli]